MVALQFANFFIIEDEMADDFGVARQQLMVLHMKEKDIQVIIVIKEGLEHVEVE